MAGTYRPRVDGAHVEVQTVLAGASADRLGAEMSLGQQGVMAALVRKQMSRKRLAEELDVREETLSRWLSGRLVPSMLARIALEHVLLVPREDWEKP